MLLAYELIVSAAFIFVMIWTIRSRDPIMLGAVLGGFLLSTFDWLWCSRGFWNATIPDGLTMIPGLNIQGVRYPFSICFIWAIGFGFLPFIASRLHPLLSKKLGALHIPVILAASALIDLVIEGLGVSFFGAWTYHQKPEFLIFGMPWSNFWFLGGVLTASYFGFHYVRKWAAIPPAAGFSLKSENTWKGLLMAAGVIWSSALVLCTIQLFWWSATSPWVESGRPF